MKRNLGLFVLFILLVSVTSVFSQVKLGPKFGFNLADMLCKDKQITYSVDYKMKFGFHFGGTAEYSVNESFFVEASLLFSTKGYKLDSAGKKISTGINYIELPINAVYKIDLRNSKLVVFAGPYFGFAMSGKMKGNSDYFRNTDGSYSNVHTMKLGSDKDHDDLKHFDYGLNLGAGYEKNNITVSLQYGIGLANLSPKVIGGLKARNMVIGISCSYKFYELNF